MAAINSAALAKEKMNPRKGNLYCENLWKPLTQILFSQPMGRPNGSRIAERIWKGKENRLVTNHWRISSGAG